MITKSKARSASARFAALIFDTKWVGEETYIITIGSDGYFEGIGMSDEIKEELMELIVVGDLPTSEDNITDYFIKLREGLPDESP